MELLDILYRQLDAGQRAYFNLAKQIGPYAYPCESGRSFQLDESCMLPVPNIHTAGLGPFPERRLIEEEIREIWGDNSIPMLYFQEIFKGPSHDSKNKFVPSVETERALSL